jgi:hypothetical protein
MTDWALALKMVRFLIIGGVRTKALKTHLLFSALKSGVKRTCLDRFANNHITNNQNAGCNRCYNFSRSMFLSNVLVAF